MPILIAVDGSGWSGFIRIYWASQAVFEDNRPAGPVKRQKYPFLPLLLSNEKLPKYIFLRIAGISARNICCGGITLTLYACHMDCIGVSINSQNEPHRIVQVAWWNEYAGNCPFACRGDYAVWLSLEQLFHCIVSPYFLSRLTGSISDPLKKSCWLLWPQTCAVHFVVYGEPISNIKRRII